MVYMFAYVFDGNINYYIYAFHFNTFHLFNFFEIFNQKVIPSYIKYLVILVNVENTIHDSFLTMKFYVILCSFLCFISFMQSAYSTLEVTKTVRSSIKAIKKGSTRGRGFSSLVE